ncbi:DUF2510 domain-containing protein [Streptomyces sp. NPDC018031]|uniref:DUF2510 domain-containing protein n=1 Tax=Streptomyces sp. NPDC018031 TaxID=3365033 RepID=UPI0037AA7415
MSTPPGWYPDPTHQGPGPAPERWWDGSAWTDHRRDAQAVHSAPTMIGTPGPADQSFAPAAPGYPPGQMPGHYPGHPPGPGGTPRGRGPKIAAVTAAAVVVVAAIVGGVVLLTDDDKKDDSAKTGPSATAPAPGPGTPQDQGPGGDEPPDATDEPTTDAPTAPPDDPRAAEDMASGISLPVLDGWRASPANPSGGAGVTTLDRYPCPGAPSANCVRGGAFSYPASGYRAKTAEGIAKEDIAANAEDSYGTDPNTKQKSYGGIGSHKQLKSEAVTVAGEKGYLVRWKVDTRKGDDGYVQTLAFPSPSVPGTIVVVRFGFDVNDEAPSLADMDRIVKGIKPISDPGDNEAV